MSYSSEIGTTYSLRRSVLTASQKARQKLFEPLKPLKSVENYFNPPDKMNGITDNQTLIKKGVFADYYTLEGQVGRGKFATVKKCRHKVSGQLYAAKFLRKRRQGKSCRDDILKEVKMLELAREHLRLVHLVEVYETNNEIIIVTEYASGGELFQHVIMEDGFEERFVVRWMRQIISGLAFLHEKNIVHLDIKPQNILLTNSPPYGDIKLCDFGFARTVHSGEDVRDIIGTPDYVAPEVLSYEPIKPSCDMWSVGVLAYVMLTGCSPFAGETKMETFSNITQVDLDFPADLFEDISDNAIHFIRSLLVKDASMRLTARDCLCHRWLSCDELTSPAAPSPFGSPMGYRRALNTSSTNTSIDGTPDTPDSEPKKRCKCAAESMCSTSSGSLSGSGDELDQPPVRRCPLHPKRRASQPAPPALMITRDEVIVMNGLKARRASATAELMPRISPSSKKEDIVNLDVINDNTEVQNDTDNFTLHKGVTVCH